MSESVVRIWWFGRWVQIKNWAVDPASAKPFDPAEPVASGDFRRFNQNAEQGGSID